MDKDINGLIEGRNLFDSKKYLFGPKVFCLNQKNFVSLRQFSSTKIRPQAKIYKFLLSRIAILLLKDCFEREKIIFHKKNFKHKKIILL